MNVLLPHQHLSFSQCPFFHNPIKTLHFLPNPPARASTVIRMGGGPRTYPGGVSKWQWKRMQAKKAKQLLKARLCRERQIYEMRKRAELKAAVSELERPWEVVERVAAPNLFSVGADEQVKVLADRFQKPGGFDMWSESDGPVLFESPDELPSARFFPKGVVHSVKPYRRVDGYGLLKVGYDLEGSGDEDGDGGGVDGKGKEGLVKGIDFGGDLCEKGDGRKGIEFGGDGREVLLEGVNGFGFEGGGDGEYFSSSSLSDGREEVEYDGDLRENGDGRGFLLEGDDGSEWESDDGECSFSGVSYGRNGVKGDGGLRRNGNGRRSLSDDVGRSGNGGWSSRSTHGRNGVDGEGRLRRNGHGRRFLSSSNGEQSSRLNYGKNGVDGDGRTRRNGLDGDGDGRTGKNENGRRFLSNNVDRSSDGERSSLNYGRNVMDDDDRLRRNGNGRRVLSDDVGRSSDGGRSSHSNYQRRAGGRMRRNGNGSTYSSRGVDGADDIKHSPRSSSSGRYGTNFDGRMRNKGSGRRVLSKDVDRSAEGGFRSKENGGRFMSKDVDESNGSYSRGAASVRKQRGGSTIRGRSRGKDTNRTSDYASRRGRNANSEVYDMGLQQDGSYGFLQKHEQPDSTGW